MNEAHHDNASQLLAALKAMRKAYGKFYRGNAYITVAYEAELEKVNQLADAAIKAAEATKPELEYQIAFVKADGSFDVVQTLLADSDEDANDYAEHAYAGREWYVLDANGRNINGGVQ